MHSLGRNIFLLFLWGGVHGAYAAPEDVGSEGRYKKFYVSAAEAFSRNQIDEALQLVRQAEQAKPAQANTANLLGAIYTRKRDWAGASTAFRRALQLQPALPMARFNLAEVFFLSRQYSQAKAEFEAFLREQPDNDLAQYKIFLCEILTGNHGHAEKISLALKGKGDGLAYAYAKAAEAFQNGNREVGLAWIQEAKQRSPCGPHAMFADSLVELGFLQDP